MLFFARAAAELVLDCRWRSAGRVRVNSRICWNCGHDRGHHTFKGDCAFVREGVICDCPRYEDGEFLGHQRKRDLYTLSDRRRLGQQRVRR